MNGASTGRARLAVTKVDFFNRAAVADAVGHVVPLEQARQGFFFAKKKRKTFGRAIADTMDKKRRMLAAAARAFDPLLISC